MSREQIKQRLAIPAERNDIHIETLAVLEEIREELKKLNGR